MRAAERIARLLRQRIALGGFPPGSRLPTERELAATLGVSRNTTREAIRSLADDGIVETSLGRGGGTRVVNFGKSLSGRERQEVAEEFRSFIRHRMEHRVLLEPAAAEFAAVRGDDAEKHELVELLSHDVPDLVTYHQIDTAFHLIVAKASKNPVILESIIAARTDLFLGGNILWLHADWSVLYGSATRMSEIFRTEHSEIATAITAGNGEAAARHMRAHLIESTSQFMQLIETSEDRSP